MRCPMSATLEIRGGEDRNHLQGKRRLFIDAERHGITGGEVRERIKTLDERRMIVHRIVLSPGFDGVDMEKYTPASMSELERAKGRTLEYYATEHKNTDFDHTHVVILGNKDGNPIRINRSNYKTIREAGDRCLEKYYQYEQYLDKTRTSLCSTGLCETRAIRASNG